MEGLHQDNNALRGTHNPGMTVKISMVMETWRFSSVLCLWTVQVQTSVAARSFDQELIFIYTAAD